MEAKFVDAPIGNERRNMFMVSSGQTHLDMMPATPARLRLVKEGRLRMIPVSLDRGLLGYRLNILLESQREKLAGVRTPKDLRLFVMGQNEGWMWRYIAPPEFPQKKSETGASVSSPNKWKRDISTCFLWDWRKH